MTAQSFGLPGVGEPLSASRFPHDAPATGASTNGDASCDFIDDVTRAGLSFECWRRSAVNGFIESSSVRHQRDSSRFSDLEAGTGNIADAVGLGAAIDYVTRVGIENIARYEHDVLAYATSVLSFVLKGYETEEFGRALNEEGIAVRSGHHCAQPVLRRFGVEATVRPPLAFYNTCDEVDRMVAVVKRLASRRV